MIKRTIFLLLCLFPVIASAQYSAQPLTVTLHDEVYNLMITGDAGIINENITAGNYYLGTSIEGNSVKISETDTLKKGFLKLKIEAISQGTSMLILKFTNYTVRYKVDVSALSSVKTVKISEISKTPENFFNQYVILSGVSIEKAKKKNQQPDIHGKILRKSDWIFQDESGMLYVTGQVEPSADRKYTVLCTIEDIPRMGWIVRGNRLLNIPEKK